MNEQLEIRDISNREFLAVWIRIALLSFGGPAGQISVMHRILVEEKRWLSEEQFLHALNYCMLLPGPEAMQLATYVGWLKRGVRGGLIAGILFVLPGFISILGLSIAYGIYHQTGAIETLFFGLKAAVLALVLEALMRIGKRALRNKMLVGFSIASFALIFFLSVPFPLIILLAGITGFLWGKKSPETFGIGSFEKIEPSIPARAHIPQTLAIWLTIWFAPILALIAIVGVSHIFVSEAWFFSKTAVVTFGGAYAVLAYIAQRAVEDFGWLQPGEMLDGLGLAETTPGPLIQVVQFVGFMAAYRNPGSLDPITAGIIASVIVTWVTFVPCFLWIFLGAPYIERLRNNRGLTHALTGITAAVVGVILNLAIWFGVRVLVPGTTNVTWGLLTYPQFTGQVEWGLVTIMLVSFVALQKLHWNLFLVLGLATYSGWILHATF